MKNPFDGLPREVAVLTAIAFSVAIGYGVIIPAIPLFARSFGVSNFAVGAVISLFSFMRFSSGLLGGRLVDRFGERLVLATGMGIVALSTFLAGLSQSYGELLFFRAVGGIGSSMFTVSAGSLLLRIVPNHQRGRAQSTYQSGFLIGGISGPAIGGLLSEISLRAPFFIYSASLVAAGVIAAIFLSHSRLGENDIAQVHENETQTTLKQALRSWPYQAALFASFSTGWAIFGIRSSMVPLYVKNGLDSSTTITGLGFTFASIIGAIFLLPAGSIADKRGRRYAMIIGTSLSIIGLSVLTFLQYPIFFIIAMGLTGAGASFTGSPSAAVVGDIIKGRGGQVIALYQMVGDFGSVMGPLVAGFLADHYGFKAGFLTAVIVVIPALILAIRMPETKAKMPDPEIPGRM